MLNFSSSHAKLRIPLRHVVIRQAAEAADADSILMQEIAAWLLQLSPSAGCSRQRPKCVYGLLITQISLRLSCRESYIRKLARLSVFLLWHQSSSTLFRQLGFISSTNLTDFLIVSICIWYFVSCSFSALHLALMLVCFFCSQYTSYRRMRLIRCLLIDYHFQTSCTRRSSSVVNLHNAIEAKF